MDLLNSLREAEEVKKQIIPPGFVRFERNDYHYSRLGVVTRVGHLTKIIKEEEVINYLSGCCSITFPTGEIEMFDFRVSPVEHSFHLGYGEIMLEHGKLTGTLSRVKNLFITYYGSFNITPEQRNNFKMVYNTYGAS